MPSLPTLRLPNPSTTSSRISIRSPSNTTAICSRNIGRPPPSCVHPLQLILHLFLVAAPLFLYLQNLQCVFGLMFRSEFRSVLANLDRGFENGPHGENASQSVRSYRGQAHGCDASAGCAIGIPAK